MIQPTKVIISGYGRMGVELERLIATDERFVLTGVVDRELEHSDLPVYRKIDLLPLGLGDLIIDFSAPALTVAVQSWCLNHKVPLVSGTTGLSPTQFDGFLRLAKEAPVLWAPNMSIGIAFVELLLEHFGSIKSFDFQIEETHHNKKKDKPSGTALFLQSSLEKTLGRELPEALSIRGGGVFGVHRIMAMADEETISIEHTALNRAVFARGALAASHWLMFRPKGFYSLKDFLVASNEK